MAFEVETGSGSSSATSLVSIAVADERLGEVSAWGSKTTQQKQNLLNDASEYLANNFDWKGHIVRNNQALPWPRAYVFDRECRLVASNIVPQNIQLAVCEVVKITLSGDDLLPAEKPGIVEESIGAGDGAVQRTVKYQTTKQTAKVYPRVLSLLEGFIECGGGSFKLRRA